MDFIFCATTRTIEHAPRTATWQTSSARSEGRLPQRFKLDDLREACPGWPELAYRTFLPKHRVGNPDHNWPYFRRYRDGSYCLTGEWRP